MFKIEINGDLKSEVMAKDIILHIIGNLGQSAAVYKAIEFSGEVVEKLDIDEPHIVEVEEANNVVPIVK